MERQAGARLDELFRTEIAEPLGVATAYLPKDPSACAPCEGLRGVVHDENARAMDGVAGHAGLFSTAHDVARLALDWRTRWTRGGVERQLWQPSGVQGSTWCFGWDRPSAEASSAGTRWPRDGVGHLGYTGTSVWIAPGRGRAVVLLTNRVEPTRENEKIKELRPALHDKIVEALDAQQSGR